MKGCEHWPWRGAQEASKVVQSWDWNPGALLLPSERCPVQPHLPPRLGIHPPHPPPRCLPGSTPAGAFCCCSSSQPGLQGQCQGGLHAPAWSTVAVSTSSCFVSPLWAASSFYFCLALSLPPFIYHGHYQALPAPRELKVSLDAVGL